MTSHSRGNVAELPDLVKLNHRQSAQFRAKVNVLKIQEKLQQHIDGKTEMSQTQIAAARILLDKCISEAPKDVNTNVSGEMQLIIETGVPRK